MKCLVNLTGFGCGQCYACRLNRQQEKATRINHEAQQYKNNVFITLTYSDEYLPKDLSLNKEDLRGFEKRLRYYVSPQKIRFFGCGEYGDQTKRPHYHLIVFNLSKDDKRVFNDIQYVPSKCLFYCSCKAWEKGHVTIADVNEARINYVAKYVVKKMTGKAAKEYYGERTPEFCLCSLRPGIGYDYMTEHADKLKREDCITKRGQKSPLPRYYVDKLFKTNKEKEQRKFRREARLKDISLEKWNKGEQKTYQNGVDEQEARVRLLGLNLQGKETKNNV